jgi:hypothetical protein
VDANAALIIAAAVTAVGGIIVAIIQQFRKENHTDHQVVVGLLQVLRKSQQRVEDKVDKVDERLDKHLEFHAEQGILDNGRAVKQTRVKGNSDLSA